MTEQGVQSILSNPDLVQQSLAASGVIEGASTNTNTISDDLRDFEDAMNQPLRPPPGAEYQVISEDISPDDSYNNQTTNQINHRNEDVLNTPQYGNATPQHHRFRSKSDSGPSPQSQLSQVQGSPQNVVQDEDDTTEDRAGGSAQLQSTGIISARRSFQHIAKEAAATLPLMEVFEGTNFTETEMYQSETNKAFESAKKALDFLVIRSLHGCELESQVNSLRNSLNSQRAVIQNFREKCVSVFDDAEKTFREEVTSRFTNESIQSLELAKFKAANAQLQATVAAKDAEILLLQEQLKQKKCEKCEKAATDPQPGPSVIRSPKRPRMHPYKSFVKSDILLSMRTPRREQEQD